MEPAELDFSLLLSDRCHGFSGRYEGGMEISYKSIVVLGAMLVFAGTMMLIWYKDPDPDQHVEAH
jgi:hypothetical protein